MRILDTAQSQHSAICITSTPYHFHGLFSNGPVENCLHNNIVKYLPKLSVASDALLHSTLPGSVADIHQKHGCLPRILGTFVYSTYLTLMVIQVTGIQYFLMNFRVYFPVLVFVLWIHPVLSIGLRKPSTPGRALNTHTPTYPLGSQLAISIGR